MKSTKLHFLLFFFLLAFLACEKKETKGFAPVKEVKSIGLFSPVQLNLDSTTVHLEDYFPEGAWPDKIAMDQHLSFTALPEQHLIKIGPMPAETPWLSTLDLTFGDQSFQILVKRSPTVMHEVVFKPSSGKPQKVELAGEINGWTPSNTPLEEHDGEWKAKLKLNPGRYQYQIVVDGNWMLDPANPVKVENGIGGYNSEMEVGLAQHLCVDRQSLDWHSKDQHHVSLKVMHSQSLEPSQVFAFWENQRLELNRGPKDNEFELEIPAAAADLKLSHIRVWADLGHFWSNDLFIPLSKGKLVANGKQLQAVQGWDAQRNVIYFMMVDRFSNGNQANDAPLKHPEVHPKANFHGGDLAGITQKIKEGYFSELGVNMLWLSPIIQNPEGPYREYPAPNRMYSGYHGYWPISSTKVDHRFGTEEELKALVKAAHDRHIRVILDFVANHVHQEHPILQKHPEWKTELYLEDSVLNVRLWDAQRLTTWFDVFMPSLDFDNPEVVEFQSDSALFWIQHFGLDGFRHDATKHIPTHFWRRLSQKLKTEQSLKTGEELYQIGETFGSRELIGSYVGSGLLDGQFDFNYYWVLRGIFSGSEKNLQRLVDAMQATESVYGSHSKMGNITGNHDMPRFISYAGGALKNGEDPQAAGWERKVEIKDKMGYVRLQMLQAWLLCGPGIPVIYYGDEIGMVGGGDPDNRRDMKFEGLTEEEVATKELVAMLAKLRKQNMAMLYGSTEAFQSGNFVAMHRKYDDRHLWLVINLGEKEGEFKFPSGKGPTWSEADQNAPYVGAGKWKDDGSLQMAGMRYGVWIAVGENQE